MTRFRRWLLRKIFKSMIIQGYDHHLNAAKIFSVVREVWEEEFTEDNSYTTDAALREAFESSQFAPLTNDAEVLHLRILLLKWKVLK